MAPGTCSTPSNAKVLEFAANDGPPLEAADLRRLVELSGHGGGGATAGRRTSSGRSPTDEQLWLLQSRPVTTEIRGVPRGPDLRAGPGRRDVPGAAHRTRARPVGSPAARGGARSGAAGRCGHRGARSTASDVVVCVDGHVAIDLRLAGEITPKRTMLQPAQPDPRRSAACGARGGSGGSAPALPRLAEHLLDRTDADLEAVPALAELTSRQLIALLAPEPGRSCGRCTPTRSSSACSPTPAATG